MRPRRSCRVCCTPSRDPATRITSTRGACASSSPGLPRAHVLRELSTRAGDLSIDPLLRRVCEHWLGEVADLPIGLCHGARQSDLQRDSFVDGRILEVWRGVRDLDPEEALRSRFAAGRRGARDRGASALGSVGKRGGADRRGRPGPAESCSISGSRVTRARPSPRRGRIASTPGSPRAPICALSRATHWDSAIRQRSARQTCSTASRPVVSNPQSRTRWLTSSSPCWPGTQSTRRRGSRPAACRTTSIDDGAP